MNGGLNNSRVSVIIPTMASAQRGALLQRAIESVRASSSKPVRIIVIVNGSCSDTAVCIWLQAQEDIHLEYVANPSAPGAILRGRELVETEFFSTLDDDDEYLPGTTDLKMLSLEADAQADVLIANTYRCSDGMDVESYAGLNNVPANPLECLMQFNWLTSGNAMYRTNSVGISYFIGYHAHAEWTWLAFRLAIDGKCISIINQPTCRHHNTAGSLSKSDVYFQSCIPLYKRMLDSSPPHLVMRMIQRKMGATYHEASVTALENGRRKEAWRNHWKSLIKTGGLRYLTYTRHLFK